MATWRRALAVGVCAGIAAGVISAQQRPTFRAGVTFVRVDVIVTDKTGAFVPTLTPSDFEITEKGKPQKIETFRLVTLDGGLMATSDKTPKPIHSDDDEQREAAKDDVRLFAIFLDDYHVKKDSSLAAREQIARFINTELGPSDMIGLMYPLEPLASVLMTRDHDIITRRIEQFSGRKYDYCATNQLEQRYQLDSTEMVEEIRNQVSLSALKGLIEHMGGLKEGRKALILVSEGYNLMLPPQLRFAHASALCFPNADTSNGPQNGDFPETPGEAEALAQARLNMNLALRDVYEEANHYNVSIYAVDPRRLATSEFGIGLPVVDIRRDRQWLFDTMGTLRTLSLNTDGGAIVNRNDLTLAMKQIVRDTSGYYLLGYNSTFTGADGQFHEIHVKVKQPGVDVRARKGYWALNRDEKAAATAPSKLGPAAAVENALNAAAAIARARVVRTWMGTERGEQGQTKVTFVWEPVPGRPVDASRLSESPSRIMLTATGATADPYFRGPVPVSTSTPRPVPAGTGVPSRGGAVTFDVPPGPLHLKMTVEGSTTELLDAETLEFTIPDFTAPQVSLSTPKVFRVRSPRELQQVKGDPQAVPAAAREFSRSDRLLVRVAGYGPGDVRPTLTARLLDRTGQPISELPITEPVSAGGPYEIEIILAALADGEYLLELTASREAGRAQQLVAFRVTG